MRTYNRSCNTFVCSWIPCLPANMEPSNRRAIGLCRNPNDRYAVAKVHTNSWSYTEFAPFFYVVEEEEEQLYSNSRRRHLSKEGVEISCNLTYSGEVIYWYHDK